MTGIVTDFLVREDIKMKSNIIQVEDSSCYFWVSCFDNPTITNNQNFTCLIMIVVIFLHLEFDFFLS